jgi:hypothetical protein
VGEGTTFTIYFPVTLEELIPQQQKGLIERYMGDVESDLVTVLALISDCEKEQRNG